MNERPPQGKRFAENVKFSRRNKQRKKMTDYFKNIKADKGDLKNMKSRMKRTRDNFKGRRAVIRAMTKHAKMLWEMKKSDSEKNNSTGKKTAVFCREAELGILVICGEEGVQVEQNIDFDKLPAPWGFGPAHPYGDDSESRENA